MTKNDYSHKRKLRSHNHEKSLRRHRIRFSRKLVTSTRVVEHWSQYSDDEWNSMYMNEEDSNRMDQHWEAWLYSGEKENEEDRQETVKQQTQRELRWKQRNNC